MSRIPSRLALLPVILLSGCLSTSHYATTVDAYVDAAEQVELGMNADQVRRILEPSQAQLGNHARLRPERYLQGTSEVLIQYYRSGWYADGRNTDEEFTPYLFEDDQLVAIGWQALQTPRYQRSGPTIRIFGLVDARREY